MFKEKLEERQNPVQKEKVGCHTHEKAGVKKKIKKRQNLDTLPLKKKKPKQTHKCVKKKKRPTWWEKRAVALD